MELYITLEGVNARDIKDMLGGGDARGVYRLFGPALEDMLSIQGEAEWLEFVEQQGPELEERPLCLHLAAWHHHCLELGGYAGDVTEQLMEFLQKNLPEAKFRQIRRTPVVLDIDEPSGELEPQLEPYQMQLGPLDCHLKVFFDDTYCAGIYFVFLEHPKPWETK